MPDSVYWQDIVFDRDMKAVSRYSRFRQRYGRSYFNFEIDSSHHVLSLKRNASDSVALARFTYNIKDSIVLELYGYLCKDSLYLLLRKRTTPFALTERPFHWISETNR